MSGHQIGNYLLLQFVGMALSTIIWKKIANRYKFKGISFCYALIGYLLPLLAQVLSRTSIDFFQCIFFFSGFVISAGKISFEGILLEITTNNNRAIYAGISGTLSLTTVIFPLIAGMLIEKPAACAPSTASICARNVLIAIKGLQKSIHGSSPIDPSR